MKSAQWQWILLGAAVFVLVAFLWFRAPAAEAEGFTTVDLPTATAQRQMLQMEGERRYNPVARLQAPGQKIGATDMDAAITTIRAAPTTSGAAASLLGLVGSSLGLGAADDGSGKSGEWVEQTGVVQDKINFCESLTSINCDSLQSDPRMRECGFCHRDGTNSKGKAHRGGMYISSDDQIRANEAAQGGQATYTPTVGSCKPQNFTVMAANCAAREAQLQCQSVGAPSSNNPCAQCYGKTPSNATGLLYFNPNKPFRHQVFLNVSHPGFYSGPNGYGLEVTYSNGAKVGLPALPDGKYDNVSPPSFPLELTLAEGDSFSVTVYGPPLVWCGWLSNQSGSRTVSLDIGVQTITPDNGMEIAGDKMSRIVQNAAMGPSASFLSSVPNTVLWYTRRSEVMSPTLIRAIYGTPASQLDVTQVVKTAAALRQNMPVNYELATNMGANDPAPGQQKGLYLTFDSGWRTTYLEGTNIDWSGWNTNSFTFNVQMPATLADPPLDADQADCPTGPLVLTEVGAGLMGTHSCFKPDGSFNPNAYCLQELFQAAGGTKAGTAWPSTDAAAKALVAPSGTLDDTVAALNNLGNIAVYGVDNAGNAVDYATYKDAAMRMLGVSANNPCDGPVQQTGPHSPECLDYLWRTMNNPAQDGTPTTTPPPFSGCSAKGLLKPMNEDGSYNPDNVAKANAQGGVAAVRAFYQGVYNATQNSADFGAQVAAMRDCYGTNIQPPVTPPGSCPTPAANEWRCITPGFLQGPEVFTVCPDGGYTVAPGDGEAVCASYGARLATTAELSDAQQAGAQWCACGWLADGTAKYPMQQSGIPGCGNTGLNTCTGESWFESGWGGKACVTCYGNKPADGATDVQAFSSAPGASSWNQPSVSSATAMVTDQMIPACRISGGAVQCASSDGSRPWFFQSEDQCKTFVTAPEAMTVTANTYTPSGPFADIVGQRIRNITY